MWLAIFMQNCMNNHLYIYNFICNFIFIHNTAATFIHNSGSWGRLCQLCNSIVHRQQNLSDCFVSFPSAEIQIIGTNLYTLWSIFMLSASELSSTKSKITKYLLEFCTHFPWYHSTIDVNLPLNIIYLILINTGFLR